MAQPIRDAEAPKTCRLCGSEKTRADFGKNERMTDGLKAECRTCLSAKMAARRASQRASDPIRQARLADEHRRSSLGLRLCLKCFQELPLTAFFKSVDRPDGLASQCKRCKAQYNSELYARNLEKRRAYSRQASKRYRQLKGEKRREYEARWRDQNRERIATLRLLRNAADPHKEAEKLMKRRALKAGATIGQIDRNLLWVRQCGVCGICGDRIDQQLAWPHPLSRSIDHVVPLSRGGEHSQRNVTWAHLSCNLRKGARLPKTA